MEAASMAERTVIQWDKDDLEALGLLKVDVLALGMLSACAETSSFAAPLLGAPEPDDIPGGSGHLCHAPAGRCLGVFQVESRAQLAMPPAEACLLYDLVVEVAIVRPGPIQGTWFIPTCAGARAWKRCTTPMQRYARCSNAPLECPSSRSRLLSWLW